MHSANGQLTINGYGIGLEEKVAHAHALLKENEPADGYYVAFSGGKDSTVILDLCQRSGVRHEAVYNNTTIDPPELVYHIKKHYPYVWWNNPKHNMLALVGMGGEGSGKSPPTRTARWCCAIYKEQGGTGRVKVIGVRAAESPRRARAWREVTAHRNGIDKVICPILYWSDQDIWDYIRQHRLPYCSLYDEGFSRLGCIGCPLAGPLNQAKEFERWPKYARNWKRAVIQNWERWHAVPRMDGKPRYQAGFGSGDEMWQWWISGERKADPMYEDCQSGLLYTNQPDDEVTALPAKDVCQRLAGLDDHPEQLEGATLDRWLGAIDLLIAEAAKAEPAGSSDPHQTVCRRLVSMKPLVGRDALRTWSSALLDLVGEARRTLSIPTDEHERSSSNE